MTPKGITEGPDGKLWFTEQGLTADGSPASTRHRRGHRVPAATPAPTRPPSPPARTATSGSLERGATKIGRISPDGPAPRVQRRPVRERHAQRHHERPRRPAVAHDRRAHGNRIHSFDPGGPGRPVLLVDRPHRQLRTRSSPRPTTSSTSPSRDNPGSDRPHQDRRQDHRVHDRPDRRPAPAGIAEGGDGALWFTARASPGRIGRLDSGSRFEELTAGTGARHRLTPDAAPGRHHPRPRRQRLVHRERPPRQDRPRVPRADAPSCGSTSVPIPGRTPHDHQRRDQGDGRRQLAGHDLPRRVRARRPYGSETEEQSAGHEPTR